MCIPFTNSNFHSFVIVESTIFRLLLQRPKISSYIRVAFTSTLDVLDPLVWSSWVSFPLYSGSLHHFLTSCTLLTYKRSTTYSVWLRLYSISVMPSFNISERKKKNSVFLFEIFQKHYSKKSSIFFPESITVHHLRP